MSQLTPGLLSCSFCSCSSTVEQGHVSLPIPWCWESSHWLRVASWPPSSPLSPHEDTPPLPQLPFPIREPLSASVCYGGIQMFTCCLSPPTLSPFWGDHLGLASTVPCSVVPKTSLHPFPFQLRQREVLPSCRQPPGKHVAVHQAPPGLQDGTYPFHSLPQPVGGSLGNQGQRVHPGEPHCLNASQDMVGPHSTPAFLQVWAHPGTGGVGTVWPISPGAEGLHVPDGAVSLQKGYRKEDFLSL